MGDGLQRESIQSYGSQNHNGEANLPRRVGVAWAMAFLSLWVLSVRPCRRPGRYTRRLGSGSAGGGTEAGRRWISRRTYVRLAAGIARGDGASGSHARSAEGAARCARSEIRRGGATLADPPDDLRTALSRLAAADVVGQSKKPDGSVELRVRTSIKDARQDRRARRRAGAPPGERRLEAGSGSTDGAAATRAIAAIRRTTERVRRGELKDRVSALIALGNGLSEKAGVSP